MDDRDTKIRFVEKEDIYNRPIDQIEVFIKKVKAEIDKGDIPKMVGQNLISKATNLKSMVGH